MREPTSDSIAWLARISAQQRSAVALYLHDAQTPAQIGCLLNLPLRAVCLLLLSALDELATTNPPRGRLRAPRDATYATPSPTNQECDQATHEEDH